jgi:hypothetical protein
VASGKEAQEARLLGPGRESAILVKTTFDICCFEVRLHWLLQPCVNTGFLPLVLAVILFVVRVSTGFQIFSHLEGSTHSFYGYFSVQFNSVAPCICYKSVLLLRKQCHSHLGCEGIYESFRICGFWKVDLNFLQVLHWHLPCYCLCLLHKEHFYMTKATSRRFRLLEGGSRSIQDVSSWMFDPNLLWLFQCKIPSSWYH